MLQGGRKLLSLSAGYVFQIVTSQAATEEVDLRSGLSCRTLALRLLAAPAVLAGVATVGCARTSTPAPQLRAAPFLELRLAFKDSASGRHRIHHAGTTAFLAPDALLTDEDLLSVKRRHATRRVNTRRSPSPVGETGDRHGQTCRLSDGSSAQLAR